MLQPRGTTGYCHRIICAQDYSAVTAACMLVKKSAFDQVGGLTEELAVAFNDIDFCMKLRAAGYLIVYNPYAELYHYESKSRGLEDTPEKVARFNKEIATFEKRWPDIMRDGDPYYNPNLTLKSQDFSLKRFRGGLMKVLVTGVKGQLGHDVMNELALRGYEGVGVDVDEMDITDEAAVRRVIGEVRPDSVVHCAAWTAVDAAEDQVDICRKVNVNGTEKHREDVRGTGCPHDLSQHGLCVRRTGHTALGAGRSCGAAPERVRTE